MEHLKLVDFERRIRINGNSRKGNSTTCTKLALRCENNIRAAERAWEHHWDGN